MREYYIDGGFDKYGLRLEYTVLEETKLILHSNKNRKHLEFLTTPGVQVIYKTQKLIKIGLKNR